MRVRADEHLDRRRTEQTVRLDIPAHPRQHRAACGGEADEIGDGRAGHDADGGIAWQAEQIEQPRHRDRLHR